LTVPEHPTFLTVSKRFITASELFWSLKGLKRSSSRFKIERNTVTFDAAFRFILFKSVFTHLNLLLYHFNFTGEMIL
jgi:hypothetical protein